MPANAQTMSYVGEVPWHREGTAVHPSVTAKEMIIAAGQRLNRVWFGAEADLKTKALEEAVRVAVSNYTP